MTTLPVNDAAIESALADLALAAPPKLAAEVLVEVGLADRYATIESPIGPLYVAWNGRGVSTVGLARTTPPSSGHLRQTAARGTAQRHPGGPGRTDLAADRRRSPGRRAGRPARPLGVRT
jgi:hypothetical protein